MDFNKDVVEKMLADNLRVIEEDSILEKFWNIKVSAGDKGNAFELGKLQNKIRITKEYAEFLGGLLK